MKKYAASLLLLFSIQLHAEIPVILQNVALGDFVTWYTEQTGESVIISTDADLKLTVYAPNTPIESLPGLFRSIISAHGLALEGGQPLIIADPAPEQLSQPVDQSTDLVTLVYRFQHVLADDLLEFTSTFSRSAFEPSLAVASVYVVRSLNALALTTTQDRHDVYADLMSHLDTPRPLVLLEAVIYEHRDSSGQDLGLAYGHQRDSSGVLGGFNAGQLESLASSGLSLGILSGQNLSVLVNALRSDVQSKILSTPQILVMSGERGVISVGQNVPFLASTTVSNGRETQSIERRDVGVSLTVRPFVSQGGEIILGIQLTADSINQALQASDIITNTRNLSTTVRIQSGQSIALGGLITSDEEERVSSVPFLGAIPFLGALFRSTSTETTERELNIVLRAVSVTTL
ncbi:hypothetical protein V6U78_07350 [Marinospirillum sp. MEB164]|uniref:Type II/III secretion system secretin-like domain-containing protein n=1 Tax=Marinospirillum alkalitolerans TaxID=3123374 RepID=A0ABW8PYX0_9GAMM